MKVQVETFIMMYSMIGQLYGLIGKIPDNCNFVTPSQLDSSPVADFAPRQLAIIVMIIP